MGIEGLTDVELILIVLALFYASESFAWLRGGTAWFVSFLGGPCRVLKSALLAGQDLAGPVFLEILPTGRSFLCMSWPVSISPGGVYSYSAVSLSPRGRADQRAQFVPFDQIETICAQGDEVEINGQLFVSALCHSHAKFIAENLRRIAEQPPSERVAAIDDLLVALTNVEAAKTRLEEIDRVSSLLSLTSVLLFLLVFVMGPVCYYHFRLHPASTRMLVAYLGTFLLLWGLSTYLFARASRSIEPDERALRCKQVFAMALSPVSAMRAWSHLPRRALVNFHPLTVAATVCSRPSARSFAGEVLRDALHPIHPPCPNSIPVRRETETWFRERLADSLFRLAQRLGYELESLTAPPAREGDSRLYCPRCSDQYELLEGSCASCGELALLSHAEVIATRAGTTAGEPNDPGRV